MPAVEAAGTPAMFEGRIVVIGGSAGALRPLMEIAECLPVAWAAAVFVALHLPESAESALADIVDRAGPLPAAWATDGAPIRAGTITVAPAGSHLVIQATLMTLDRGPRVNGHRPAVDVLFESAALTHRGLVAGVVLSGSLRDGTLGLRAIKRCGGVAIVQAGATHEGMPASAIEQVSIDAVLPAHAIPRALSMLWTADERAHRAS